MNEETQLRERICLFAASLNARGLTHGSRGNISARLDDRRILVTPTGSSLGILDPAGLSLLDEHGRHVDGDAPTKEVPLYTGVYHAWKRAAGAVVHLHSHHAVRLSLMPCVDRENALPALTPYSLMQLGNVRLMPYFRPGDLAMGDAIRKLDPRVSALILANHGTVVSAADLERAVYAMEELEATARLAVETMGQSVRGLTAAQISDLVHMFDQEV